MFNVVKSKNEDLNVIFNKNPRKPKGATGESS